MSRESVESSGVNKGAAAIEKRVVEAIRKAADQALRRAKSRMEDRVQFTIDMNALESAFREKHAAVWSEG